MALPGSNIENAQRLLDQYDLEDGVVKTDELEISHGSDIDEEIEELQQELSVADLDLYSEDTKLYKSVSVTDVIKIDTINNLGRIMSNRMQYGMLEISNAKEVPGKSPRTPLARKWGGRDEDSFTVYTPVALSVKEVLQRQGMINIEGKVTNSNKDYDPDNVEGEDDTVERDIIDQPGNLITSFTTKKVLNRELSNCLGDSIVVNPPHQFNPNDDIRSNEAFPNFGRIFNEKIVANYPTVIFEVGTIKYRKNLLGGTTFDASGKTDKDLLDRIRSGKGAGNFLSKTIDAGVNLIGFTLKTAWSLITLPITLPLKILFGMKKMVEFIPDISLFARYFDSMSQEVAAMLGLLGPYDAQHRVLPKGMGNDDDDKEAEANMLTEDKGVGDDEATEKDAKVNESGWIDKTIEGMMGELKKNNLIQVATAGWEWASKAVGEKVKAVEESEVVKTAGTIAKTVGNFVGGAAKAAAEYSNVGNSMDDKTEGGAYAGIRRRINLFTVLNNGGSMYNQRINFIPFLVTKDVSVNESLSNQTSSNPLMEQYNSAAAEAGAVKGQGVFEGIAGFKNIGEVGDKIKEAGYQVANKILGSIAFGNETSTIINGDARIILPDVWSNSNFSRSVSLEFTFTTPYGNRLSIFENTLIPFMILYCMTSPRQTGKRSFSNPFFIRAHMRGFFSIPMGIIESLTIKRGNESNDWHDGLPKTINCSIEIKDLTPSMMMGMNTSSFFGISAGNDQYIQYLSTIGGLTIQDQLSGAKKLSRWWAKISQAMRNNKGDVTITSFLFGIIKGPIQNVYMYHQPRGLRNMIVGLKSAFGKADIQRGLGNRGYGVGG